MSYSYVVTSQKPTSVNFSVVCNFASNERKNLILAKGNALLIYTVHEDGLELLLETPMFGKIKCLDFYRPNNCETDVLFVLTERKSFCVLGYDAAANKLVTRAVGNVRDRAGRDVEIGQRGIIDPEYRMIGMMLYEGQFKVIPVESSGMKEAFNITLTETRVIDLKFLHGCARPTLCILYQDNRQIRHVKTCVVDTREKDFTPGPWSQSNVEFGASLIIPVPAPHYGILLVGSSSITYIGQAAGAGAGSAGATGSNSAASSPLVIQAVEIAPTLITAHACIAEDGTRFLLTDHRGVLSVVVLRIGANGVVAALAIDTLGVTSIAENLSYLGDGRAYVGSIFGDSQLIRLLHERDEAGSNIEILSTHTNIGPIRDMCLVDNDKQGGQRQLVTCSGAYKDGSLRIIRSGIGLQEQASLEVAGIKALWSLRVHETADFDKFLVQSFIGETRVLAIENEEMGEVEITGFSSQEATLHCANMLGGTLVQVTTRSVRLVDCNDLSLITEFVAPNTITVASSTLSQVTLAISGGELLYLELDAQSRTFAVTASTQLDQDIACLSLRPVSSTASAGSMEVDGDVGIVTRSSILAIAMWTDNTVRLHALPTLGEICRVQLGTDTQARDILIVELGGKVYLLVGLGDGRLITYSVDLSGDLPSLGNRRNGVLGTHPITFSCFHNAGSLCVFAASDRPTVIYSKNGKILFSVLDVSQVEFTSMAPFHSELFPNCLALGSESSLVIGVTEDIQKVHIQTVPLQQAPRRIVHSASSAVYAVVAEKTARTAVGEETMSRVLFFDDGNMEQIGIFELDRLEQGISCTTCVFEHAPAAAESAPGGGASSSSPAREQWQGQSSAPSAASRSTEYVVVGTAHVVSGELEPTRGRILVFEIVENRRVHLIAETEVKGAVFSLAQVCGRLVAGVGSKVQVFSMAGGKEDLSNFTGQPELQLECTHTNQIMSLYLKVKGEHVLVGDLVRSVTLLRYKPAEKVLQEVARDFNSSYLRAVEIMDGTADDIFVGADINGNLQCLRQVADAVTDEERCKLESCGEFHVSEYINAFHRGSLVGQPIDADAVQSHSGTKSGAAGESTSGGSVLSANYHSVTGLKPGTCSVLYGGVTGAIGNIIALSEDSHRFFSAVERVMKRSVVSIGGLNHREWRSFQNDLRSAPQRNMVDGDLVEMLLEYDKEALAGIVREINDEVNAATAAINAAAAGGVKANGSTAVTTSPTGNMLLSLAEMKIDLSVEDVLHRIEDISRLH